MKPPFSLFEMLGDLVPHLHIIDVGAMDLGPAHVPYLPLLRPGKATVTGFDALKHECDRLNAAALPGHRYLPHCIGDGTERTFHITSSGFTSSLYEPNTALVRPFNSLEEWMRVVRTERVRTVRLDDVPEAKGAHFLKLDVQGAELDVLRHAGNLLRDAVLLQCEVEFLELYKGQPLFGDVHEHLRSKGFMLHFLDEACGRAFAPVTTRRDPNQQVRQMLWTDAIFVPDFRRLHEYPPERLLALAVILHEVYASVDLVAVVLNHYDRKQSTDWWARYLTRLTGRQDPGTRPALAGLDD